MPGIVQNQSSIIHHLLNHIDNMHHHQQGMINTNANTYGINPQTPNYTNINTIW